MDKAVGGSGVKIVGALAVAGLLLGAVGLAMALRAPAPVGPSPVTRTMVVLAIEYKGTFGTGEWQPEGTQVKAYRWDPVYIQANEGDTLDLHFFGVNGDAHPATIPAFEQSFSVTRGRWTNLSFVADDAGVFSLMCNRPDHSATMQAIIEVV